MHVKAGVAIEPSGDRGMFMGGVIVGDVAISLPGLPLKPPSSDRLEPRLDTTFRAKRRQWSERFGRSACAIL